MQNLTVVKADEFHEAMRLDDEAGRTSVRSTTPTTTVRGVGGGGVGDGVPDFPGRLARQLPFGSTVVTGIALAAVIAIPYGAPAVLAWREDRRTNLMSFGHGLAMITWIKGERLVVREIGFLPPLLAAVGTTFVFVGRATAPQVHGAPPSRSPQ